MVITEIDFVPIKPNKGLIGFASFVLDGYFYLSGIGVHTRLDGGSTYRLLYPNNDFTKKPQFHPITKEIGDLIEQEVSVYINHLRK